jgi:integrase
MTENAATPVLKKPEPPRVLMNGIKKDMNSNMLWVIGDSEDGEISLPPERENEESCKHPAGKDGARDTKTTFEAADELPLKVVDVLERFKMQAIIRLKPVSVEAYEWSFKRFAESVGLESYTRRQLAGPKGRMLVLTHLNKLPKPSWRWTIAALKPVWIRGLNLAWPISKWDLPTSLPKVQRRQSPSDADVKLWAEALVNEKNTYSRLVWLLVAQHGWRPSHVCRIKFRNIQYDGKGKPVTIVANENFKTCSPIAARLAPDVAQALQEWKAEMKNPSPDEPIMPWRDIKGQLMRRREQESGEFIVHWQRLEKKWQLPHLTPVDLRHWVATTSRKAGLSKPATAYMQGHDPTQGGAMRDSYDNPPLEEVFAEQAEKLPYGPLGLLNPPTVEIEGGLSEEETSAVKAYTAGQTSMAEVMAALDKVRLQRSIQQTPTMET